jgi:SAM-dependent methyltransferase
MLTIVRFNWPFYLTVLIMLISALYGIFWSNSLWLKSGFSLGLMSAFYFLMVSLAVSHQIYDRSDLYRWKWLVRALDGVAAKQIVFCHCGFDEVSQNLKRCYSDVEWIVLDHYDPTIMTEASIRRARKYYPVAEGSHSVPHDCWSRASESADVVLGLLAIHELREESERIAWLKEAKRCLKPSGRVILAEHVRDLANFIAFGPGFLHFHTRMSWLRCWEAAGLQSKDEFAVTPWVRIFVLFKS